MLRTAWTNLSLTLRFICLSLLICVSLIAVFASAKIAMAATLKDISVITGDYIKLSDIFEGSGRNANYVIGPAPHPGQDMILNARTLYRIAMAMDLPWRPKTTEDQIIVRREATIVPYTTIEQALKNELNNKGMSGRFSITLNRGKPNFILPPTHHPEVEITTFHYDRSSNIIRATIVSPSKDNPVQKIDVTGQIQRMIDVPVLRDPIRHGIIIGKNDIRHIEVSEKSLKHNTIMHDDDLIGLTPRRILHAGKPLSTDELMRPLIVERGSQVTIVYKNGPLILSAKGKALQNGARGDQIRVSNIGSSKTIDGIVTAENEITVQ